MTEKIDDKTNGATHQEVLCGANAGKDGVHKIDESETTAKNADFAAVVANRPNPWGRGHLQLYCMCFIVYLTSTMNGMIPQSVLSDWSDLRGSRIRWLVDGLD